MVHFALLPLLLGCRPDKEGGLDTSPLDSSPGDSGAHSDPPDSDPPDSSPGDTAAEGNLLGPFLDGDCDPLVPEHCGFPFPSNVYLVADDGTPTGARVAFGETTLPEADNGVQSSPDLLNASDGFSPAAGPMVYLPTATDVGLAGPSEAERSLLADSLTVILDAETGERVAHFAELDHSHDEDAYRALLLRPLALLTPGRRYIVAIRGIVDGDGDLLEPSAAFEALRDGTDSDEPSVDRRRYLYEDIFARLETAGVAREDLQIAWDFTVASRESMTDRLLAMRDEALAIIESGPDYEITSVEESPDPHVALRLEGTVSVPLYLDDSGPGGNLVLDEDGDPELQGMADYPFVLLVPESCRGVSCPIVQYGHGLFGSRYSADGAWAYEIMDDFGAVVLSMDWTGMSEEDVLAIAGAAASGDINGFSMIPDRSQQAMVNFAVGLRMLTGPLAEDELLVLDGMPCVDTETRYYLGGSQGGIYGATYMAITPDIERGVLVVPGVAYSLMLPRSVYWAVYGNPFLVTVFDNPLDVQLALAYVQMLWDRAEPSGYVTAISEDPFPGTPAHRVLLMEAIGDHQVPNLATEVLARSIGASYLAEVNRELLHLDPVEGPLSEGSALIDYDFGLPDVPEENVPMEEGDDPHGSVFVLDAAQASILTFLTEGVATNPCDGACDPE